MDADADMVRNGQPGVVRIATVKNWTTHQVYAAGVSTGMLRKYEK